MKRPIIVGSLLSVSTLPPSLIWSANLTEAVCRQRGAIDIASFSRGASLSAAAMLVSIYMWLCEF